MKLIVISGASSGVGKTTLAKSLQALLPGAERVKIGHGKPKPGMGNHLYPLGTSIRTICDNHSDAPWLLIESNSILHRTKPDLVIYLEGEAPKPSAEFARSRADIVSGRRVSTEKVATLAARLEISVDIVRYIVCLSGAEL